MPDPILDLVLKRKAAKERISMRGVQAPAPGFVPVMADNNINDQFQIDQIDTEIKGMGLDPMKVEDKIGDLPSYIPNHIVTDILNIEDPIEFKRKKAATKWQGTLYNRINNIPDPAEKEKGVESFNFLIKGYTGSGKPNYESTVNGIRAAKDAINASLEGDEKQDAISNLKYDAGFGLAQTLLQDPEAQKRWSDIGLNPLQGLALDIKEIFDPTGVEYKKQVTGKFQDPAAQAEQRVKLAELENEGINILGEEISYLIDKKSTGVKKANDFYTENQPRLQELKAELEKDKTVTEEQKQSILGFQQEYDDVLMGKEGDVYKSPFTFGQLKDLIDKRIATPLQIREYNNRVEKLNGIAQKYKQGLDQYNQTTGAQNAAAREYNNIVNTMQDNLKDTSDYNNLGAWADYLAKQKNSQAERFPEFSQIQMEQLVEDVAGANLGAGSRFVYNLANATGGEAINGLNKLWNNLTLSGDALREAEMGDAYRSRVEEAMMTYETKDQALKERAVIPVVGKQTEDRLAAIDASNATDDEKYQQKYRVIEDGFNNKDITYAANPKFGKLNLTSASILNTASSVTSQLIGQLVQAYATGGMGNVSKTRQLSTLFGTVFAQTFGRTYDQAVREGKANPFEYAVTQSTVEALSELPFNNLAMVEKLMPSVKKFAGNLTEGQWKGLIAGKLPSNLGREIARTAEGLAIEGGLEEGLAGVGSNLADKYLFGGNKELFEDVDTQVLAGVIGFAPMSALGLPLRYRSANMGDKLMMYHAGYKADNIIKAINQQLADGTISQQEATERIEAAKQMKSVIDKMPLYDVNGKPLSDYQKAQYAWNEYTKIKAKDSANLPAQQQEELKQLETEADQNSSNILNGTEDATPKSTVQQQEGRTESNILQPARVEDGQPEIGQGAGIQGQAEIPQANVGYSDTSGQEVDITETPTGLTEIAAKVVNDAFQTAKSLATAGIKVRVFQNQEDFERESQKLGQQARGQGVFISDGKNILINLSKINSENDWGIVWHEGAHPVLNIIRNTNPELYNNMAKGFGGLAKQGGVFAQIEGWAAADYGDKTDVSTDEAMVETVSLMADGKIKLADIPTSFRQQVTDFVNQVAEFLGLGQLADTSERVFAQKAAQIANTLRAGADVATVVGEENITRTENPFVGQEKKDTVRDNTPKPRDFKAAEEEVKALIEQQASQPEAVVIEPQRDKDGKLKISVDFDEDGKRVVEVKYKQAPYELKKGALKFVDKDETKAAEILSDQIAVDYRANEARPEIAAGIGWYSKMRQRFQKFFGANIETFGQLLAATSARTGVFDNFKQSVEAFKLYSQGQYNDLMKDYDAFVKDIQGKTDDQLFDQWKSENPNKRPGEFDAREYRVKLVNRFDKVPLKANGKKYNANSKKVLQALYGNWLQQTEGPKTKNFAGNLTGRSFGPTIDVWAARYLRRLIYQGKLDRWRIPPSLEKGVDYSILVSGEMSGDYPFAEKVMQMAADKIGINADDLQAFLWYLEKDVWDKNGWTNKAGAEKASFEQGADTLDTERYQAGVTTFKDADTFDPVKFEQERIALEKEIGSLPGVVASRVTESIGEFYSTTGIYVEPTFDVEFTMEKGADVAPVRERIQQILKDYKQDATLFSKLVDRENPNARPIIEIGLAEPVEKSQIIDDIKAILAEDNVRGFTLAKDSRGRILGVRSQFVPEFEQGVSIEDGVKRFVNAFEKIKSRYGKDRNISYLASGYVDTEVKFQEDGKESQQDGGDSGTVTGMEGQPQQSPAGPLSDQQPESGRDNQGGSGDAGGMGQEPGTGQQRRSSVDTEALSTAIQERKSAAKITGKAIDSIKDQVVKLGYGYLPDDVRERLKKKQRQIDADLNDMNVLNKRFETAVRESYGVKYKNLTPEQKADLDLALRNFEGIVSRAEKDKLRDQIPDSVMGIIDEMRFTVDSMSKNLVDLGIMDNSLEPAFDGDKGLGVYLTRTYRKYDDPEWVKNVPELVRARAKTYLATNNTIKEMDAQGNIVERPLTEEELDGLVNYIASNTDPVMEGLNAANAGKVKVDILKGRKVIPEEIRELMGEYKDPSVNFARSIAKMSTLINTHQALKEIAEANIGTLFFREPQGEYFVPVAGKDATALQPLSGLYSTKEIADAFKEAQATFEGDDWNLLALRALAWINGAAKIGKTALSPASWVRNVIGGHIIMLKDGHIGGTGYADGWKSAFGYFFNKEKDSPEFQAKMREYIENGILGEGVAAGEFQAIVKAAYGSDNPLDYIKKDTKLGRATEFVKGFYSAQDDIFRVWSYENEKARLINRKPNMSEAELQSEASRKARATYPTYSELPEVVRKLAKFIPISSFPAFSAELIRTTKNSVAIALEEMKDPDMRDIGIKRMAGVITAISFGSILSGLSSMIVDVDDEEEKSLRRFLPEWSKNSQLIWLGRDENGLPKYIDLGFSDPFSYFKKPFVAFTSDKDNVADRAKDAVKEATAPFVSPEIFLSAMVKGNKVVNESDDMDEVIGKYAGPIYEALEPGLIASGRRILKGVTGEVDRYGQQYDAGLEATAFFTGQRIKKFDPSVGFAFKAKEFNKRRTETLDAYYMEKSKTVKNEAAMEEELTNAEQKFIDNYSEFKKDYDAAMYLMTLNMTAAQAKKVLDATMKDRGVPEMFRKAIKNNKPYPGIMKKD